MNYQRYPKALNNRPAYGGIYTTDLVILSFAAFIITRILKNFEVEIIYTAIAAVCIPLYLILVGRNKYCAKASVVFWFRKILKRRFKNVHRKGIYAAFN